MLIAIRTLRYYHLFFFPLEFVQEDQLNISVAWIQHSPIDESKINTISAYNSDQGS